MKSEVKASAVVFNRGNHGTDSNYVLSVIKTNKIFPIEATDPNNLECLRIIISISNPFF